VPQTLTQLTQLLAEAGLRPQKRHGQHFLIDLNLMRLLVAEAGVGPADTVLEIGPGTGSLTELLSDAAGRVVAVDIDPAILSVARKHLAGRDNITWIRADILRGKNRLNPEVVIPLVQLAAGSRLLMVSNLPYGAGTPVIANALTDGLPFAGLYVTVQKEVADRLAAAPGTKDYGPLTVTVQSLAAVKVFRKVPASAFWPRPDVESAMVSLVPEPARRARVRDFPRFDRMIEAIFTQRRKGMRAAVKAIRDQDLGRLNWAEVFAAAGVSESDRPDRLSVETLIALSNAAVERIPAAAAPAGM
jgi:16S rRNA (adenine1518-N6/adenine1519-N6)-dimethyltransferase